MEQAVASKPPSNSEQAVVDETAKAIASSLQDRPARWHVDEERVWLKDGGMAVHIAKGAAGVQVRLSRSGEHYSNTSGVNTSVSSASQDFIWSAYKGWQEKRMVEHAGRPDPEPEPPPPPPTGWLATALHWLGDRA